MNQAQLNYTANVLKSFAHHKITAEAIEREVNPNAKPMASTIRIPTVLLEKMRRQADELARSNV